ncbi:GvpL/GvpF family gas vesicle protein [bacterium]|nr:GvpL/GvpF family gas vesicle protein [bacterium]
MEEYFIISESEIEQLLEEAKAEALEMVKAELKTSIAEIIRKKIERKIAQEQQSETTPVEEKAQSLEVEVVPSVIEDVSSHQTTESMDTKETLKEIERIKSQIVHNEELLQQAKAGTPVRSPESILASELSEESDDVPTQDEEGLYFYCITNELERDIAEEIGVKGIDGQNPVFSVSSDGLSAVVSRIPLSEFNESEITQKAASGDLSWFEAKSRHHELVIRSVMEKNTVIPMKFCTIYTSEESVLRFLAEHQNELRESLDYFAGKSEWGVKVYCNVDRFTEEKSKQQPNEEIKPKSPGVSYFAKRKKDIVMEKELRQLMYDMSQEIYDRLAQFAVESRQNELVDSKATGKEEPMILNAAYLIKQSELEAFNNELAKIQEEQNPYGYELEISGPWPPYNFIKST